jgi:hypothetical protein
MPRSKEEQASRRSSPYSIGKRDPSLKWPHLYDLLRAKGYDKEKSARISNSRVHLRKKGKLKGLPYRQADSRRALKGVLKTYQSKHGRTASAVVAACYSAACAPPPVGTGGSIKGIRRGRQRGLGPVQHPELIRKVKVSRRFEKLMRGISAA